MERPEEMTVKLSQLEKFINKIKETIDDDCDISFEVLLMNTFPLIWNNIQEYLNGEHTRGYLEGFEAGRNDV